MKGLNIYFYVHIYICLYICHFDFAYTHWLSIPWKTVIFPKLYTTIHIPNLLCTYIMEIGCVTYMYKYQVIVTLSFFTWWKKNPVTTLQCTKGVQKVCGKVLLFLYYDSYVAETLFRFCLIEYQFNHKISDISSMLTSLKEYRPNVFDDNVNISVHSW